MSLDVFRVLLKLNQHFSIAPHVFNVIFNNISADMLPLRMNNIFQNFGKRSKYIL